MGHKTELNRNTAYEFALLNFGTDIDKVIALAIDLKTKFNAHAHSGTGVAPSSSTSISTPVGITNNTQLARMRQNLPGLDGRFTNVYNDSVLFISRAKQWFNAHQHAAIAGAPTSSIALTPPASISLFEAEQWNRAYYSFYASGMGTKLRTLVTLCHNIKTMVNSHHHPSAMTNVPSSLVTAGVPTTLT